MPSSYTTSLRLTEQATGENLNTWGTILNAGTIDLLDGAIAGRAPFALSGTKTLTSANGAADEARMAFLDITGGSGGTVTIPSATKLYLVRNNSSGNAIFTTGSGTTVTIPTGSTIWIACDATNVRAALITDFQGSRLTNVGTPSVATDGANKSYADSILVSANSYADGLAFSSGNLPGGQVAGYFLTTNGTTPSWSALSGTYSINIAGNSAGTHTGPVVGNVTGNLTGNVTGNVSGNANTANTATTAASATFATSAGSATTAGTASAGVAGFTINALRAARVASGSSTNTGRISWGTAAPGSLDEGEFYGRYS